MKDKDYEQLTAKIMMNALEGVKAQIRKAYDKGYKDGSADIPYPFTDTEETENKAYNRGLNDAWEVIKKITKDDSVGGYSLEMMQNLFSRTCVYDIVHNYTASEAIAKIKAYEDKQDDEIKVGDEVRVIGSNPVYDDCDYGVCTYVKKDKIYVMRKDGSACEEHKSDWEKTGRTFPRIAEVLVEMRGAENDE